MEGIAELIPFLIKDGDTLMWNAFLKSCKELRVFAKKSNESIPLINSLLNENESRLHGMRLLELFINQSPRSTVNQHIVHWFHQCLKGVAQPSASVQSAFSYLLLCSLLEVSTEFPDVKKQTSQVFIPKILDTILERLREGSQNNVPILKCLFACLFHYGRACGSHRDNLEGLLIKLLSSDSSVTQHIAKCFHLLAQCGSPGAEFLNYKLCWESQHLIVINSLHSTLDQLYTDVNEILGTYNQSVNEKRLLDIPPVLDKYPLLRAHKLSRIFSGLCQILENMLLDSFPASKILHPEAVLGVICRSLAVTCKSLESKISISTFALMAQLCDVHISVIKLFNSLILFARTNLLSFSSLITKLFIQIFKWTCVEDWPNGKEKPFSAVRQACYRCLMSWLSIGKSCSFTETQINIIVEAILKDIKCSKKVVSLNLEKKAGKTTRSVQRAEVEEAAEKIEMNVDTCCSALSCIPPLLQVQMYSSVVKNLQEAVVKLLFEIQRSLKSDNCFPPPYSKSRCRAQLYSTLLALCISPHPQFPPPLHYANLLFNAGASDMDIEVAKICSHAVISISHMLRPCAPSFDFHADLDSEIIPINVNSDPSDKETKAISKRARQAYLTKKYLEKEEAKIAKSQQQMSNEVDAGVHMNEGSRLVISDVYTLENTTTDFALTANTVDENRSDELIDLADSSDESIILVDSKKNDFGDDADITHSNISELNSVNGVDKSQNQFGRITRKMDGGNASSNPEPFLEENLDRSIIEDLSNVEAQECPGTLTGDKDKLDGSALVELSIIECHDEPLPPRRSTRSNKIIEEDETHKKCEDDGANSNNVDNTKKTISDSPKGERRLRSSKAQNDSISMNPGETVISEEISLIESDEVSSPLKRIMSNTSLASHDNDASKNNSTRYETKISDDISIIEHPDSVSPLRRSKRNDRSSPLRSNGETIKKANFSLNDSITIIHDEEEPPPKKLRSFDVSTKGDENEDPIQTITDDSITLNETEDDEMLNSFVDSVPD